MGESSFSVSFVGGGGGGAGLKTRVVVLSEEPLGSKDSLKGRGGGVWGPPSTPYKVPYGF